MSLVRGEGVYVYDEDGHAILDGASGAAVSCLGHGNRRIADRMAAQAGVLAFAHGSQFVSPQGPRARRPTRGKVRVPEKPRLLRFRGLGSDRNSTEDCGSPTTLLAGVPSQQRVVSRSVSYHGAALGALAMTGHKQRRRLYESLIAPFPKIPTCYCYRSRTAWLQHRARSSVPMSWTEASWRLGPITSPPLSLSR